MSRSKWGHVGTVLKMNALNHPHKLGWQDTDKEFTFQAWNERSNRMANGLKHLGANFKDTFAVIAYNRGEWMDIYAGCAKGGQVVAPSFGRLTGAPKGGWDLAQTGRPIEEARLYWQRNLRNRPDQTPG